ncbi:glycosyltransferase family 2 protein [Flavobacterium sp. LB3P122]|uniref:glycosyltransferase family 2 protein n=1 Tax=Flavobacterium algoriphilum TaxID=3398738 RepID=UPI003A8701EC
MIIIYHNGNKVVALSNSYSIDKANAVSIISFLLLLAKEFPDAILVWCHISLKEQLNVLGIEKLFHHHKLLLSYNPSDILFLDKSIGYVEESPFIKINKSVTFPTWQMSGMVGGIHSSILVALKDEMAPDKNFDYFLCSLAKLGMRKGLLCYSEPKFLKQNPDTFFTKNNKYILFRFVKQHYKTQWTFLLLLNLLLYERKFPIMPFICSLFYKNRSVINLDLDGILIQSSKKVIDKRTIDVIIPTIGRRNYLYDVLKDFSRQNLLPNKIIIVEQNSEEYSETELDYIQNEKWPFEIQHFFIHQAGACHARNLALNQTDSEWVFLADDDNRFESDLLEEIFKKIEQFGNPLVTTSYPQENEFKASIKVIQWPTFGAGNSFVRRDLLNKVRFNMAFEFGFGEDGDFGMQLRNKGYDILYLPDPEILHLKAPVGGFRTKPTLKWQNDTIQPKPSPTIMLYQILHSTQEQIQGYKTILFFKYYKYQTIKNPVHYFRNYKKQWKRSVFWANELKKRE